ncbi:MAG: cytochrome c biogenesis protein CcdA [Ruminococcaceae bacterium]|nr:cytochrome c biogenesis protein CcdA [Oscillospiraceae bacterium]
MQYFIAFLEGVITFISPCLLPMLPVYVSYFAGGGERKTGRTVVNASGFILGFTIIFVLLGALAGTLGRFLVEYRKALDIVTGGIVILFGLNYLGLLKLNIFKGFSGRKSSDMGFFSAMLFGMVFSIGWTPCVGAFLGSALMLATSSGKAMQGVFMLLTYSLGLGIPFLISAILIDRLKSAFSFIKKNYMVVNRVCGVLLVIIGILMATGVFTVVMSSLN